MQLLYTMKPILIGITGFVAATSIIGGIMMLRDPNGTTLHLSLNLLQHSNFKDFIMPGYILTVVVGGTNFAAALSLFLQEKIAWLLSIIAGIVIAGWIAIEIILTRTVFWLQFLYMGVGIVIVFIAFNLWKINSGQTR